MALMDNTPLHSIRSVGRSWGGCWRVCEKRSIAGMLGPAAARTLLLQLCALSYITNVTLTCFYVFQQAGASPTTADFRGRQALHLAASGGQVHSVEFLLRRSTKDKGEDPKHDEALTNLLCPKDLRGFTPLHLAAFSGHLECLQSLLQCRAYKQLRVSVSPIFS